MRPSPRAVEFSQAASGSLAARKPTFLCEPSQNGLADERPHRHSATVVRPGSMTTPSWVIRVNPPRINSGPSSQGVTVTELSSSEGILGFCPRPPLRNARVTFDPVAPRSDQAGERRTGTGRSRDARTIP